MTQIDVSVPQLESLSIKRGLREACFSTPVFDHVHQRSYSSSTAVNIVSIVTLLLGKEKKLRSSQDDLNLGLSNSGHPLCK